MGFFSRSRPPELLFDLERDPREQTNQAGDPAHAHLLGTRRAGLERWMLEADDPLRDGAVEAPPDAIVTPADSYEPTRSRSRIPPRVVSPMRCGGHSQH